MRGGGNGGSLGGREVRGGIEGDAGWRRNLSLVLSEWANMGFGVLRKLHYPHYFRECGKAAQFPCVLIEALAGITHGLGWVKIREGRIGNRSVAFFGP